MSLHCISLLGAFLAIGCVCVWSEGGEGGFCLRPSQCNCGGRRRWCVWRGEEKRGQPYPPPPSFSKKPPPSLLSSRTSPPPPLSSASVLQNNQLVVNNVHCSCKAEQQLHIDVSKIDFINVNALTDNRSDRKKTVNNCKQTRLKSCLRVCLISPKQS